MKDIIEIDGVQYKRITSNDLELNTEVNPHEELHNKLRKYIKRNLDVLMIEGETHILQSTASKLISYFNKNSFEWDYNHSKVNFTKKKLSELEEGDMFVEDFDSYEDIEIFVGRDSDIRSQFLMYGEKTIDMIGNGSRPIKNWEDKEVIVALRD